MLTLLRISGFALIEEVELPLGAGLTVITGETGAGKSIVVEALGLLRGGRASADLVRTGRDEAAVEAVFDLPVDVPLRVRLEAEGRNLSDGLFVRRVIARTGRSRAYVGGGLATAGELLTSVGTLVDITSQHDQQSLMDSASQCEILDAFAGALPARADVATAHRELAAAVAARHAFDTDARVRTEREDFLRFGLQELVDATLQPGEDETLRALRERIKGAEKFLAACTRGEDALYSGEDAVAGRLSSVSRELQPLAALDATLLPMTERLREAQALVQDVAAELGRYAGKLSFEPGHLEQVEERLFLVGKLVRRHGGSIEAALQRKADIERELSELGSFEQVMGERRASVESAQARLAAAAEALSARRKQAARALGTHIDGTLRDLGLRDAQVSLALELRAEIGLFGAEDVRFLFAPNPGEAPRPLAKIASGGELSRVMLAVKRALASADQASTYVFDEVDTGVGGGTAEVIGLKLKAIAADRQVLAVTHLPQIAAFADRHILVTKEVTAGRTTVHARALSHGERTQELARMLGGSKPSRQAAAHAEEMLERARGVHV